MPAPRPRRPARVRGKLSGEFHGTLTPSNTSKKPFPKRNSAAQKSNQSRKPAGKKSASEQAVKPLQKSPEFGINIGNNASGNVASFNNAGKRIDIRIGEQPNFRRKSKRR